jgi:hypothetical protein
MLNNIPGIVKNEVFQHSLSHLATKIEKYQLRTKQTTERNAKICYLQLSKTESSSEAIEN